MDIAIIFKIAAVGLITAIVGMMLKRAGREEIATVISVVGLAIAFIMMLDALVQLYDSLSGLFGL